MKIKTEHKNGILFLVVFTLPMFMTVNNIVLGFYIFINIIDGNFKDKIQNIKCNIKFIIPVTVFFLLALLATCNTSETFSFRHLEKYWSFLLIPIVVIAQKDFFNNNKRILFIGLMFGCIATLLLCYFNVIYEVINQQEPLIYILRWRHLGHEFTEIADTHPSYLGLFISISMLYLLFYEEKIHLKWKSIIVLFFIAGIFQLASRIAILMFSMILISFFLKKLKIKYKQVLLLITSVLLISITFFYFGSNYLRDRIFNIKTVQNDYRIERLDVSYQLFLDHPILGVGFNSITEKRKNKYIDNGYIIAANKNYNAHNQFIEYLSLNGFIGGLIYLGVFFFLTYKTYKDKDWLFLFLFITFFISNLTESMLVRIKGIEYFAIFASLYLSKLQKEHVFDCDR